MKNYEKFIENLQGMNLETQVEVLKSELGRENDRKKSWRFSTVVFIVTTIILLIISKCEGDKMAKRISEIEKANQELLVENQGLKGDVNVLVKEVECLNNEISHLKKEIDFLEDIVNTQKKVIDNYENQKPALVISEETKNGKNVVNVKAIIVTKSSNLLSEEEFECSDVEESFSEGFISKEECDSYIGFLEASLNELKNESVEVEMNKKSPDGSFFLGSRKMSYADMLSMEVNPVMGLSHTFTEYCENPYRTKKEKSFRNGLIFGIAGVGVYGITELGHPIFRDPPADNSDAKRKSNTIKGLRIGAGVLGAASIVEFTRAWHFHRLEGKYIVGPTTLGVSVNLSSLSK